MLRCVFMVGLFSCLFFGGGCASYVVIVACDVWCVLFFYDVMFVVRLGVFAWEAMCLMLVLHVRCCLCVFCVWFVCFVWSCVLLLCVFCVCQFVLSARGVCIRVYVCVVCFVVCVVCFVCFVLCALCVHVLCVLCC